MNYYSTEHKSPSVSFKQAILAGLAPDRGLYMPEKLGTFDNAIFSKNNFQDVCFDAAKILVDQAIPDLDLKKITDDAFYFPAPVKEIHHKIFVLELFHGPTAAFKDFGARFMARVMSYFLKQSSQKITILVATSGDTGSAVAKGFYKVPNIDVIILYPSGQVSHLQEKQLTTLGENITALEVSGTFDDCQHMVKEAFMDQSLTGHINLSSANSINIGRLYPQSFYYIWAYNQMKLNYHQDKMVFCTPSGNFGNLTAGLIAKKMGLPVNQFIAATNINDVIPEYLLSGNFKPRPSKETYSNAMDVGNPSNFARMMELYPKLEEMKKDITGFRVTDEETVNTILSVYNETGYILDPHGAVGYKAVQDFRKISQENLPVVLLETAHPAKFSEIIEKTIKKPVEIPPVLKDALEKEKVSIKIDAQYQSLKKYLLSR
jgi:threonine synthase